LNLLNRFLTVLLCLALLPNFAAAFVYDKLYGGFLYNKETPGALYFFSEIRQNDDLELSKALRAHDIHTIVLASPGGNVWSGLRMADKIFDLGLNVYVPEEAICASACSFMFFAGKQRQVSGKLGVHQFATANKEAQAAVGEIQENAQITVAEIIGRLNLYNTPRFVFEKMFQQIEMYWFDMDEKRLLETLNSTFTPNEKTFADQYWLSFKKLLEQQSDTSNQTLEGAGQNNPMPNNEPEFTEKELITIVQNRLNDLGCNAGKADGVRGPRTDRAIKLFAQTVSVPYESDILFTPDFIEALVSENAPRCPKIKSQPRTSSFLPAKIGKHWRLVCRGSSETQESYARVEAYNSRTGEISLIVTGYDGITNSYFGKIKGRSITLFDIEGYFNETYTRLQFNMRECPSGLIGYSVER
jgi:ATP-dependent protease ClpP protease subunit